jgi:ribonuclease VapC
MIIDSSALLAIVRREPEAQWFVEAIRSVPAPRMSAANYLEASIVIDGARNPVASRRFDEVVEELSIVIEPVTPEQARIARQAYRDFGKGSGHPAQLNFGDCFAYALAIDTRESLLYKGNDFTHTGLPKIPLAK